MVGRDDTMDLFGGLLRAVEMDWMFLSVGIIVLLVRFCFGFGVPRKFGNDSFLT